MILPILDIELNGLTLILLMGLTLWVVAPVVVSAVRQWWRDRKVFK